jgi:hypothetical protein
MPMRAYRATTGYVSAHIGRNMWMWIGIFAAATVIAGLIRWQIGHAGIWGDLLALCGCILGTLVMVQSQVGFVSEHVAPDDDEDDLPAALVQPGGPPQP